jgi:flagellar hook-associated protein 3 FlgL
MRITGGRMMSLNQAASATQQEAVAGASEQVTTGKRVTTPSDDPVAWASAQRANVRKLATAGGTAAMETARDRLYESDNALATIGDAVADVRMLAVQGSNDSNSAESRAALGAQVRALFAGALRAANAQSPNGEYLLAGANSLASPFSATGTYTGDAATRTLDNGTVASIAGDSLTAANGVDVLPLLARVAQALETNDKAGLAATLNDLDTAVKQVASTRSRGGAAQSVLDTTLTANAQLHENLTKEISRHVEVDSIEAATRLAKASQALEASRVVSSHITSLLDPRNMGL